MAPPKNARKTEKDSDSDSSDSGPDDKNPPPSKKSKESIKSVEPANQWTLEKLRQVRINEFRGRKMVDIREFYEKDGKLLPGKKGISLTLTQWTKLMEVADEVTKALKDS